jgi:hypothetical protein
MKTTLVTLLIVTMACFVAGGTLQASFDPNNGLVAHYPFDGNASDMSGNGNHGTVNGASLGTDRHGISGKAYSFDGVDDFIDSGNSPLFALNEFTISLWFKEVVNPSGGAVLVSKSADASGEMGYRIDADADNFNRLVWSRMGIIQGGSGYHESNIAFTQNTWTHVVGKKIGDKLYIYVNGATAGFTGGNTIPFNNTNSLLFGKSHLGGDEFGGSIDDVRIYNRALSAADVTALYEMERPIDLTSGLVAHYPFDGNASDMSGNGNHGTVNGASLGTDRHGISGNAYSFDGVDDSIQTPVPSNQPNVSFGGWFLTGSPNKMMSIIDSDVSGNYGRSIIANYDGSGSDTLDKSLSLQFHNSAVSSLGVLNASTWYHAFATFDESQNAKLFLNGQIVATATEQTSPDGTNFRLGTHSSPFYFEGTIDNVRIYNRALSAADVAGLYELERPKDSDFDGLFDTYETYLGTDPNVADTDGDGLNDGQEVTAGTNPKISDKTVIDAVKVNSANFGLAPLSNLTATGATPHTNGWYYQPEWGWVWTNANVFPYVYRSSLGGKQAGWLYFREGSAPPYFHDYATGTWTKLGE